MPNVLEALTHVFKSFVDEDPKAPLHVGEVMNCWTYVTMLDEAVAIEQIGLNTTTDVDLREFLEKAMAGASSQSRRLKDFMQEEGIPLPPVSEPKPKSDPNAVPLGAKMTDNEIANVVSVKIALTVIACATTAAESIRADMGLLFTQFQVETMTYGATIKTLMRKRGWLKVPPYYSPPGLPNHQSE